MARPLTLNSPQTRIMTAIDSRPGEYLAVETIGQIAEMTSEKAKACLPGHMTHLMDRLTVERARIANPAGSGRSTVWGYRRTQAEQSAAEAAPVVRKALSVDPAAWALANPPRGFRERVASLSNADYYRHGVAA